MAAAIVSIVASEILLGLALLALFIPPQPALNKIRWPAVTAPLVLWMVWTLVSLAASGHPREGFPQIKKFIWFAMLFVVYNAVRELRHIRGAVIACIAAATLSSAWAMVQFARKYHAAQLLHRDFYSYYVADRITGFMGHWMTFSGQMMMALVLLAALVLFSRDPRGKVSLGVAGILIATALYFAETRSMWGGAVVGVVYLLWFSRRWLIVALPVLAAILFLVNPFGARERMISIVRPHGDMDSNNHRAVLRRIGVEMIRAHPLLGVGPEQVGKQYQQYIPPDVPRPLPTGYYGHLHNIYFHYAAERGLPALAALLWFLGRALYDFARTLRRLPTNEAAWILHGAIAVILAMMVGGYEEVNLGDSEVLALFLGAVALGYSALDHFRS
jgi:putative inorganic carbon (hco3(-)) transporter